jgi:ADP-heptose:LPS heptosyltransferase
MKKILIHSNAKILKDKISSPKNYPFFDELIIKIKNNFENIQINQLGQNGDEKLKYADNYFFNTKLKDIQYLINEHDLWISVDSFLPHYCNCYNLKPGIVLWNISDPKIFGYPQNINLIKDDKFIRENKFLYYKKEDYNQESFIECDKVFKVVKEKLCLVE